MAKMISRSTIITLLITACLITTPVGTAVAQSGVGSPGEDGSVSDTEQTDATATGPLFNLTLIEQGSTQQQQNQIASAETKQVESRNFPDINAFVEIEDIEGETPESLDASNFEISEDGRSESVRSVKFLENNTEGTVSTALVIDRSGSMGGAPIQSAKDAASAYVDSFSFDDEALFVSFANSVTTDQLWTRDKTELKNAINSISAGGGTALFDAAFQAVISTSNREGRSAVIVLTDGQDNAGRLSSPDKVIEEANKNEITIYTIGLGGADADPLREMAGSTGGEYFPAPDPGDLPEIYDQISGQLQQQYLVQYTTTNRTRAGGNRTIKVDVSADGGTDTAQGTYQAPDDIGPVPRVSFQISGETVEFNASASSDPNGRITEYRWDFENDGDPNRVGVVASNTYESEGEKEAKLTVTDNDGNSQSRVIGFNLSQKGEANLPPIPQLSVQPKTPTADSPVTLSAVESSDPNGDQLSYEWDVNANGTSDGTSAQIEENLTEGTYQVRLTVSDGRVSNQTTTTFEVVPPSEKPKATFEFRNLENNTIKIGESVTADASGSTLTGGGIARTGGGGGAIGPGDRGGPPDTIGINANWRFGDGALATGGVVTHEYDELGEKTVRLTVTVDGVSNTTSKTIDVEGRDEPYIQEVEPPAKSIIPQEPIGIGISSFPNTWEAEVLTSGTPLEEVVFEFPGGVRKVDDRPTGGDASVSLDRANELNAIEDGRVEVTATDIAGNSVSQEVPVETFTLPVIGNPYRVNSDNEVVGGISLVNSATEDLSDNPLELEIGLVIGEITASVGASAGVTHPVGTRDASFSADGSGSVGLSAIAGPGVGIGAALLSESETELTGDRFVVEEVDLEGQLRPEVSVGISLPSLPLIGSALGAEARLEGTEGIGVIFDTRDDIEIAGGRYRKGLNIVPLEISGGVTGAEVTVGGTIGAEGVVEINREGLGGTVTGTGAIEVSVRVGWLTESKAFGPQGVPLAEFANGETGASAVEFTPTNDSPAKWEVINKSSSVSPGAQFQQQGQTPIVTAQDTAVSVTPLTKDTLADNTPAVLTTDDQTVAAWSAQQPELTVANGTEIVVQTRRGGDWQETRQLTDNKKYDTMPDIGVGNGTTGLAWSQVNQPLSVDLDGPQTILNRYDIVVSGGPNSSVNRSIEVTDNQMPDLNPKVVGIDSGWLVAWAQDTDGDISTRADREVRYAVLSKDFSEVRSKGGVLRGSDFDLSKNGQNLELAVVQNQSTGNEVTRLSLTDGGGEDSRVSYSAPNATEVAITAGTTAWLADTGKSQTISIRRDSGIIRTLSPSPTGINSLQLFDTGGKRILTYDGVENQSQTFYQVQQKPTTSWTTATPIGTGELSVREAAPTADEKGITNVVRASPSTDVRADVFAIRQPYGPADLDIDIDAAGITSTAAPIEITVANKGEQPAPSRTAKFTSPSGVTKSVSVPDLEPGEQVSRSITIDRPVAGVGTANLSPPVAPGEAVIGNNDATVEFGTEMSVEQVDDRLSANRDTLLIDTRIKNNGPLPTRNINYTVQAGAQTKTATVGGLGVNESRVATIQLDASAISTGQVANVSVVPASGTGQNLQGDLRQVTVRQPDVGVEENIRYGPVFSEFGQQVQIFLQSGDTGSVTALTTFESPSGNTTRPVSVPPATDADGTVYKPIVLTVPSTEQGNTLEITTSPRTGLDTDPRNNFAQGAAEQPSGELPTLEVTAVSDESRQEEAAIGLNLTNNANVSIGEVIQIENGSVVEEEFVVVNAQTTRNITVSTNVTGNVTVNTIAADEQVDVELPDGPRAVVPPNPPTDTDSDGRYEDINGDGGSNVLDVVALFDNLNSDAVQNSTEQFDFNGDGQINILDVVRLSNEAA